MYIKKNLKWMKVEQDTFDKINRIVDRNNLLTYPNCYKFFNMSTHASVFQLGAIIVQIGKLITFYSIKLTDTQKRYT